MTAPRENYALGLLLAVAVPLTLAIWLGDDEPPQQYLLETTTPEPTEPEPAPPPLPQRDPVRVLYVADQPTWEYRYLKNALKRVDPSIEVQVFLMDASDTFLQERSGNLPPLNAVPSTREDLAEYDVILIGDVPPTKLAPTPEALRVWLYRLEQFVYDGGGVGFLCGPAAMPEAYRGTEIEELLPVELGDNTVSMDAQGLFQVEVPSPAHPAVQLLGDADANRRLWSEGLPGQSAAYPVRGLRAGAELVLRRQDDLGVIAAVGTHGKGHTFFLATDETWRWRNPYGEKYHDAFWRNVVFALSPQD